MSTQGRQQSSALSFHRDTQLCPPNITGHDVGVSQRSLPALLHHPPDPTNELTWGQLGGRAEPGTAEQEGNTGSSRTWRKHWPGHLGGVASAQIGSAQMSQAGLVPLCVTTAGQSPAPSPLEPFLFLLYVMSTSCPRSCGLSSQTAGGEH